MLLRLPADWDPAIFQYLELEDLLAVRACSRAARRRSELPRAARAWAVVRPASLLEYIERSTLDQIKCLHAAYVFTSSEAQLLFGTMKLPMMQWAAETFLNTAAMMHAHTFVEACARGQLPTVQWLAEHFALTPTQVHERDGRAFRLACIGGHVATAEWLDTRFWPSDGAPPGWNTHTLYATCANGHLNMVKWLVVRFHVATTQTAAQSYWAFHRACEQGHLPVAQWLAEQFRITVCRDGAIPTLHATCAAGHLDVAMWLVDHFGVQHDTAHNAMLRNSCEFGHLEIVRWLVGRFAYSPDDFEGALDGACKHGHLAIAQFLNRQYNRRPWLDGTIEYVLRLRAVHGNLDFVKWFVDEFQIAAQQAHKICRYVKTWHSDNSDAMAVVQWLIARY